MVCNSKPRGNVLLEEVLCDAVQAVKTQVHSLGTLLLLHEHVQKRAESVSHFPAVVRI